MYLTIKKIKAYSHKTLAMILLTTCCLSAANAQQKKKLSVGDDAPALKYYKWIQGDSPITAIDPNKIYVFEFWATWCGPCIAAMPHLSELSKKYAGKIDFIGCDVWENKYGGPKEQEYYFGKVSRAASDQRKLGRLTYNVIMDNNAEDMGNGWLKAAGIGGIPSSFVIQKGKIAWIGHPHYLDSVLVQIAEGKYDIQAVKKQYEDNEKMLSDRQAKFEAATKKYKDAEASKDYDQAIKFVDEAIAGNPAESYMYESDKFQLLMDHFGNDQAIAYAKEVSKKKLNGEVLIANLYVKENLPKPINAFAIESVKKWEIDKNPKALDILATFQVRGGFYKDAAESELKAVSLAKSLKDDKTWGPIMTDGVIADYQKKADDYQKKAITKP